MRESQYQKHLVKRIEDLFPGCIIQKNDPDYIQGIPDLTIYYGDRWAMLEVKKNKFSDTRPNQEYYVERLNEMSFAAFIFPENEEEVLSELSSLFTP